MVEQGVHIHVAFKGGQIRRIDGALDFRQHGFRGLPGGDARDRREQEQRQEQKQTKATENHEEAPDETAFSAASNCPARSRNRLAACPAAAILSGLPCTRRSIHEAA